MSTSTTADAADDTSSDPSCSSCAKLKEALEASKKEHSLTLRMVKEKIISTDELIKKYQQKCVESDKHLQQATDFTSKLEAAQLKIESLQSQLERSLHSSEPLRKNVARLHLEKSLADSTISELREKVQKLEKLNSAMMSTAKLKDEQECAWRLEKQVQAHEVQKQRKSLEKNEAMIAKLQEQLKKEKDQNKEINKSLMQANKKTAKLEQQLQKFKEEMQSVKLDAELARAIRRAPKPRQKRKTLLPAQPCKETEQASLAATSSSPNQHMVHIIQELRELSQIGPALSPLPPSPERGTLESNSSSEDSDSDSGSEDDREASDGECSDSSLGDLADMIIGDNSEPGEFVTSTSRTGVDTSIGDEEMHNKSFEDSVKNNSNVDNNVKTESLTEQTPNTFISSEDITLANCEAHSHPEQSSSVTQLVKNTHSEESSKNIEPSKESKFTAVSPRTLRKGKRRVASPKSRVMTRSRTKAMKLSTSSEGESSSDKETGKYLKSSQGRSSESSDIEFEKNGSVSKGKKLGSDCSNEITVVFEKEGQSSNADDVSRQCTNIGERGHSADSLLSLDVNISNDDNSDTFPKCVDSVTTNDNSINNENNSNLPDKLDIETKEKLPSTSESAVKNSDDTIMDQRDDSNELPSSEHNICITGGVIVKPSNEVEDNATPTNVVNKQTLSHGNSNSGVSTNTEVAQLQTKESVLQQRKAALKENDNEILEVFEDVPEQLEFNSDSALDTDSSDQSVLPLKETHTVSGSTVEGENPGLSTEKESAFPEQVSSLSDKEVTADSVTLEEFSRDLPHSSVKTSEEEIPEVGTLIDEIDVNRLVTSTTTSASCSSAEKDDINLDMIQDVHFHCSSTPNGETSGKRSSTMRVDVNNVATTTSATSATTSSTHFSEEKLTDGSSEGSSLALTEDVIWHSSDDARQSCLIEQAAAGCSKTESSVFQEDTVEITEGNPMGQKARAHSDCERDIPSNINQEVGKPSIFSKRGKSSYVERNIPTFRVVIEEAIEIAGSSSCTLDAKSELEGREPSWSPNKVEPLEKGPVKLGLQDSLQVQALIKDLGDLIGDPFCTLSPLPPSPCPSDDEACLPSPIEDFNIGNFPPLSPLPPSPCYLVDEVCPASPISISDSSKQGQKGSSNAKAVVTTTESLIQRHPMSNYTELSSKSVKKISLLDNKSTNTRKPNERDVLVNNQCVKSKSGMLKSTPLGENKGLKRSLQQSSAESGKDINLVSQCKKMKTREKHGQKQENPTLLEVSEASSVVDPITSKAIVCSDKPMMEKQVRKPSKNNVGNKTLEESRLGDANNSAETAVHKDSKYRPLSVRPKYQSEINYALKCLKRLHDDNVQLSIVVERFRSRKCLSSRTPLVSAVIQFLKKRDDDLVTVILEQLEQWQSNKGSQEWKPVISGFEKRLLDVITKLSSDHTTFGNLIPQLVTLCSRSVITARCNSNDEDFKGIRSLCRVLTALCQLKDDLVRVRVICYDVMRSLYGLQKTALELVVAMVTVWPEILKTSPSCLYDEQSPLFQTLKLVLLNWSDSSSQELGNILRSLCGWGVEPVTQEMVKDLALQLTRWLLDESRRSVYIGEDGTLVADRHSFELVKSLELLSCVLGWQWTMNELIIRIWRILETWASSEPNNDTNCSADVTEPTTASVGGQNEIVKADQRRSTKRTLICCCQASADKSESDCRELPNAGVTEDKGVSGNDQLGGDGGREICLQCGKLTKDRLAESHIVMCIQLLGVLCRIAIENQQTAVPEIADLLCGLIEDMSTNSNGMESLSLQTSTT